MFDSHDDDLWEVPSIDVDEPVEAATPAEEALPAPEPATAAEAVAAAPAPELVEAAAPAEDESSTDGYDQTAAEAPEDDGYDMDGLDGKLLEHFAGKIVRKDLTALMKRGANVPTFVLEYLLGMYCSTDDEDAVAEGLDRIRRILTDNYVRPDESERIKSKIRELGRFTIIDKVTAKLDEYKDIYAHSDAQSGPGCHDRRAPVLYARRVAQYAAALGWLRTQRAFRERAPPLYRAHGAAYRAQLQPVRAGSPRYW